MAGWRRLAPLRRGDAPGTAWPAGRPRSSPTTWLAAIAGAGTAGTAGSAAGLSGWVRVGLALWAAFVLAGGVAARVTSVIFADGSLVVRRALLPDRAIAGREIRRVVPPRWPLGAWRLEADARRTTLMPSDLRGAEAAVATLVREARLRFRDGAWRRAA